MTPTTPILDLQPQLNTTIDLGNGRTLPIAVRRMKRQEWFAFKTQFARYVLPRGDSAAAAPEASEDEIIAFYEQTIGENITLAPGLIRLDGQDVTTGERLMEVFCTQVDVLSRMVSAVFAQNVLCRDLVKNSSSPRASETGSATSPARGGRKQGSIARSAARSSSAPSGAAMGASNHRGPASASSGETPDADAVRSH